MHTDKPTHTIAALVPSASASSLGMSSIGQNSTTPGDVVPEGDEVDEVPRCVFVLMFLGWLLQ